MEPCVIMAPILSENMFVGEKYNIDNDAPSKSLKNSRNIDRSVLYLADSKVQSDKSLKK